ncbi:MAG: metallophosphoesterase, partial [Christensenellaceae bacterium]|nr:metallophosphoesterase [Christensenellaceae bacterium]
SETCHMDAIIFGGDYSNGALTNTKAITFTELNEASKLIHGVAPGVPQLWLKGNHDDAPYMSTANRLTADESYTRIGIRNTLCGAVIDPSCPNGNYGYKDFPAQRIRVIYLNTDDKAAFESAEAQTSSDTGYLNAHHLSAGQIGWLINTALDFSDKAAPLQWGIIACSHVNLNVSGTYTCGNTSYSYSTANAATILDAYESGLSGSVTVDGESIEYDFSSGNFAAGKRAHIVCVIHGHDHALLNVRLGMNQFHSIGCPNVMNGRERVSADGNIYTKTADTANDTSFTMITVDRAAKKVYADCYGAGYDRVFDY